MRAVRQMRWCFEVVQLQPSGHDTVALQSCRLALLESDQSRGGPPDALKIHGVQRQSGTRP